MTFVPEADAERVVDALAAAGAGRLGDYERCAFTSTGTGTFTPLAGADPAVGRGRASASRWPRRGSRWCCARHRRTAVVAALRAAHPYEEPAFDVLELVALAGAPRPRPGRRAGRAGGTLRELRRARGGRAAGDRGRGAGRRRPGPAGAHGRGAAGERATTCSTTCGPPAWTPTSPPTCATTRRPRRSSTAARRWSTCSHWATEWPWLADCARLLARTALGARGGYGGDARLARSSPTRGHVTATTTTDRRSPH